MITAHPDDEVRARALDQRVVCYLREPVDEEALLGCVRLALQRASRMKIRHDPGQTILNRELSISGTISGISVNDPVHSG